MNIQQELNPCRLWIHIIVNYIMGRGGRHSEHFLEMGYLKQYMRLTKREAIWQWHIKNIIELKGGFLCLTERE